MSDSDLQPESDDLLKQEVFVTTIGRAPVGAAVDVRTYFTEVHRCCRQWLDTHGPKTGSASAFVLSERIDLDPAYEAHSAHFAPTGRLDIPPSPPQLGPIILTSRNLRVGYAHACADGSVAGIVAHLLQLGLGSRPTAIFVPGERTLSLYVNGVDSGPSFVANTAALESLDPSDLSGTLEYFHQHYTRYPDGLGTCWDNAGLRIVERHAERNIRNSLFVFLSWVVYGTPYVTREHQLPNGRVDVFVYGVVLGDSKDHRVLELKVLRSRSAGWKPGGGRARSYSEAANYRYVHQGVRQAERYRLTSGAREGFLLCFDARLAKAEIDVASYASERGVVYRWYWMESSTDEDNSSATED